MSRDYQYRFLLFKIYTNNFLVNICKILAYSSYHAMFKSDKFLDCLKFLLLIHSTNFLLSQGLANDLAIH